MKPLPKIGFTYHFFDDGKHSEERHYICKCERILTKEEAKSEIIKRYDHKKNKLIDDNLISIWEINKKDADFLFANDTDFFIECSCPNYDKENNLWFVRTKEGTWFSMNIQNSWQSGYLDVDAEIFNNIIEKCYENNYNPFKYLNEQYEKLNI